MVGENYQWHYSPIWGGGIGSASGPISTPPVVMPSPQVLMPPTGLVILYRPVFEGLPLYSGLGVVVGGAIGKIL